MKPGAPYGALAIIGGLLLTASYLGACGPDPEHGQTQTTEPTYIPGPIEQTTEPPTTTTAPPLPPTTTTVPSPPTTQPRARRVASNPVPKPEVAYTGDVAQLVRDRWPDDSEATALLVVDRESRFVPTARNRSGATGLFQLMPLHAKRAAKLGYTWAQMSEPGPNIEVALDLFAEQGWGPWKCRRCSLR